MTEQNGLERSSATDKLRRLLDERGVEYRVSATGYSIDIGPNVTAYANRTATTLDVSLRGFTPEQAVAATLGPGTCRALDGESSSGAPLQAGDYDEFWEPAGVCSECGELIPLRNYCPGCGRKVVC